MGSKKRVPNQDDRDENPARGQLWTGRGKILRYKPPNDHLHGRPVGDLDNPRPRTTQQVDVSEEQGGNPARRGGDIHSLPPDLLT